MSTPSSPASSPEPALQTAARLLAEARPDEAVAHLGALVASAPAYAAAHVLHATALEAAGRLDEASAAWDHAAFLVPRSPLVRRERQRLAARLAAPPNAAPVADDEPDDPFAAISSDDLVLDEAPPADAAGTDAPAGAIAVDDLRQAGAPPAPADPFPPPVAAPEPPTLQTLPLESLTTLFDTDTPFFADDDEDDALLDEPLPGASEMPWAPAAPALDPREEDPVPQVIPPESFAFTAPEPPPPAPPLPDVDWGDLPLLEAPLLSPEGEVQPSAPPPPVPTPTVDWRVVADPAAPGPAAMPGSPAPDPPFPFTDAPAVPYPATPYPDAPAGEAPAAVPADDLDALISQLEQAPRIRPDPGFAGPAVEVDESGVDEMVSETLAQIYAAQHRFVEAAVMYEKLAAREPAQAPELLRRAAELRSRG